MGEENTTVDVLSLEDFHATIAGRLAEATSLLTTLTTTLQDVAARLRASATSTSAR